MEFGQISGARQGDGNKDSDKGQHARTNDREDMLLLILTLFFHACRKLSLVSVGLERHPLPDKVSNLKGVFHASDPIRSTIDKNENAVHLCHCKPYVGHLTFQVIEKSEVSDDLAVVKMQIRAAIINEKKNPQKA